MTTKKKILTAQDECFSCENRGAIPGNCHIECLKPDPEMTGHKQGINGGWFFYPLNFDPVWKTKMCSNFELAPTDDNR